MKDRSLSVLRLTSYPIFRQLQLEEALLRADERNWCLLNEKVPCAIVMGISGKQEELINDRIHQQRPVPIIRRFSGGGTVFVDESTLFVTFICNSHAVDIPCFPHHILSWSGTVYQEAFKQFFDFSIKENDYVVGDKKFGGNAQYLRKERWLHHSSFLWDFDTANMDYLKMPPKIPSYRRNRQHSDFLCRLCDLLPSKNSFYENFFKTLSQHFFCKNVSLGEAEKCLTKKHRKSTKSC